MTTAFLPQDRLVEKEVALGVIREFQPPQDHLVLSSIAPLKGVESDDVIFQYTRGLTDGLAPARAEDAESELAQHDETSGTGFASVIDWSLKDHYSASDVSRFRDNLILAGNNVPQLVNYQLTVGSVLESFQARVQQDAARRRRKLDNRIEQMGMDALFTGGIHYDDGKMAFTVDFGRPDAQTLTVPPSTHYWNDPTNADPIGDLLNLSDFMQNTKGVRMKKAIISSRILIQMMNSQRFRSLVTGDNPLYTVPNWNRARAAEIVANAAELESFIVYDSVYRTRAKGSTTTVNNRFTDPHLMILMPSDADLAQLDDAVGFAATLTSPHPEGNWQSGYYEWEQATMDPWGQDAGTGIKAFPVFPHLDLTVSVQVLDPAYVDPITGTEPGTTYELTD